MILRKISKFVATGCQILRRLQRFPTSPSCIAGGLLLTGGAEGQGEEKGGEEEGRKGEGKGFAGLMSNCFLRACMITSIVSDNRKCRNCNDHQHGFCHCQTSNSVDSFAVHRPSCTAVTQAARVVYAFSHHPDKLRALEMMEPVCLLLSTVTHQTVCATSQTCAPVLRVLDFLSIW